MSLTNEQLLAEVEDILRSMPPRETLRHPIDENSAWIGRVSALIMAWDMPNFLYLRPAIDDFYGRGFEFEQGFRKIMTMLHEARHDLRMKTIGPLNAAVGRGNVFDYFDEVRKIVEPATQACTLSIHFWLPSS